MHLYVHFLSNVTSRSSPLPSNFSDASSNIESDENGTEWNRRENGKRETMEKNMIFFAKNLDIFRKHTPGKRTEND